MRQKHSPLYDNIKIAVITLLFLFIATIITMVANYRSELPREIIYSPEPEFKERRIQETIEETAEDIVEEFPNEYLEVCIYEDRYLSCAEYLIGLSEQLAKIEESEQLANETCKEESFDEDFTLFTTYIRNDGLERKFPLSESTQKWVWEMCKKYELPYRIILGMLGVETTWNENPDHKEVHSGQTYVGIGCVSEKWHAKAYKEKGINIYTLKGNIEALCDIIHKNYEIFNDIDLALMAYNMGTNGARYQIENGVYNNAYTRQVHFYADSLK